MLPLFSAQYQIKFLNIRDLLKLGNYSTSQDIKFYSVPSVLF